ncbi:Putative beta-barrel porin-2, OmpL-like. bbp2 [Parapedobacter composti]|uniref:Putative beta-barrel porin-2, OmpL-like. bbp2 n=1 Tax=Parapedobacter composti TaxID=623281 RepID=A0A1I1JLR8_9SPHI|nr:outer membrane beta-barrel protein [Parapedobacter composti]SFC49527.1 Putative beta-barrel porin-2, OmpL-like. bbp2 [Parapedobacter composti]
MKNSYIFKSQTFTWILTICTVILVRAQDESLTISGSVDAYYKYDFAGYKNDDGLGNIPTSFANEQNSVSLGMLNLILGKTVGKASFVGDVSFGPRGQYQSLLNGGDGNTFNIQNLYMSYAFTDKFSMTAGFMGTFVGYEIISPAGNFNYSTSYLFSAGPFQNAGIKAQYEFSDKVGLMVGLFNDWNAYQDFDGVSDFGAQLRISPVDGWDAYINFLTGGTGAIIDLTTAYQVTEAINIGLNAADFSDFGDGDGGYSGGALYLQYGFSDAFALGVRGEYYKEKEDGWAFVPGGESVTGLTLSANVKAGPLTMIPEFRLDNGSTEMFYKNMGLEPTKSASQFSLALVYAF